MLAAAIASVEVDGTETLPMFTVLDLPRLLAEVAGFKEGVLLAAAVVGVVAAAVVVALDLVASTAVGLLVGEEVD